MGILDKKICSYCKEACKSVNADGFCSKCEEKINNGELVICSNDGCDKKAYIDSPIQMCEDCHFKESICIKCGKTAQLDNKLVCQECNKPKKEETKSPEKSTPKSPEKSTPKSLQNSKSKLLFSILILVILSGGGFFVFNKLSQSQTSNQPTKEKEILKNKKIDIKPGSFSFITQKNVPLNTKIESNSVTITGINTPTKIKITNGEYSINNNKWTNLDGIVKKNDKIKVQHTSANSYNTITSTLISVGDVRSSFESQTKSKPTINTHKTFKGKNCSPIDFAAGLCE